MQKNCSCRLDEERKRNKTVNCIINKSSKLVLKEYESRHDWMGNGVYWEFCKWLKFNYTAK